LGLRQPTVPHAVVVAAINSMRTLDVIGWQHACRCCAHLPSRCSIAWLWHPRTCFA